MSNALAQIYALQQRELNEKTRREQQQAAKHQRLISAFNASGLTDIFNEFRTLPLRAEVRRLTYKQTVNDLTYHANQPLATLCSMGFAPINGGDRGPRWWCEETDTGRIRYGYSRGAYKSAEEFFDAPQGLWLDSFIEYIAAAADTNAVVARVQQAPQPAPGATAPSRRQIQVV